MSQDAHGHGNEQSKPSNPFFIIGFVLFIAFFALQSRGGVNSVVSKPKPTPKAAPTPNVSVLPALKEQGPTFQKSILNEGRIPPPAVVVTPQVAGIAPWSYQMKFQHLAARVLPVEGTSYQQKYTIYTANLGPEAADIESAAVRLTPKEIQDTNLHLITYLQHLTANHTQCFYDEENGFEHHPNENIFSAAALRWSQARGGSKILQSTISTGKLPLAGYDLFNTLPDEKVAPDNGLTCYTQDEGDPTGLYKLNTGEQVYNGDSQPPAKWTPELFCPGEVKAYLACLDEQVRCDAATRQKNKNNVCDPGNCSLSCKGNAHTVYSTNLPSAMSEGGITDDLAYLSPGEIQGYTYTQFDNAFNFTKTHGTHPQVQTDKLMIFQDDVTTEKAIYAQLARLKEHIHAFECTLMPKEKQDPANPCPTPEPEPTDEEFECPIDIVLKMTPKDSACKLCNASSLTQFLTPALEAKAVPRGLSKLAIKIIEAAADTYHVPAPLLVATMLHEGSFEHPEVWTWSDDENIKKFSDCKVAKPMPSCNTFAHPVTGAKGPFGFIDHWWDLAMKSGGPYKALLKDPKFKSDFEKVNTKNLSSCNFVDAAFMSARELGEDQSHLYVPGIPLSCPAASGYPGTSVYQGGDPPASCGIWAADRVALARLQYGDRVCSADTNRVVAMYGAMRCGGK